MDNDIYEFLRAKSLKQKTSLDKKQTVDLLHKLSESYLNDGRSYLVHERITILESGFTPIESLRGFDALDLNGYPVEVKTSNLCKNTGPSWTKLSGAGRFSNMKLSRLDKHENCNLQMLIGNFANGKLLYILQFPYDYEPFKQHVRRHVELKFKKGDEVGKSCGVSFTYKNYERCPDLKLVYCVDDDELKRKEKYVSKGLLTLIRRLKSDK